MVVKVYRNFRYTFKMITLYYVTSFKQELFCFKKIDKKIKKGKNPLLSGLKFKVHAGIACFITFRRLLWIPYLN